MKCLIAIALASASLFHARFATADEPDIPSFRYVFVSGGYESRRIDNDGPLYRGPGFGASLNLGTHFVLDGGYSMLRSGMFNRPGSTSSSGGLLPSPTPPPDVSGRLENQAWSAGLGAHRTLAPGFDLLGSASYLRNHVLGVDGFSDDQITEGWGSSAGLRYLVFRNFELNGDMGYSRIRGHGSFGPSAGLALDLNHTWSLAASHSWMPTSRDTAITLRASFDARK